MSHSHGHTSNRVLLIRSLVIATILTIVKIAVFLLTNSLTILASAADSFMDLLVSLANYALLRSSSKPADDNHPYGHGKIESLAGIVQSLIIGVMTVGIAILSIRRLAAPEPIYQTTAGIVMTLIALAFNIWHSRNLHASMLATHSQIISSEYLHYVSDTLMYIGILLSLGLTWATGHGFWDPLISLLIVVYLINNVVELFRGTLAELLDASLPDETLQEIDDIVRNFNPSVIDYHDLRTRKVGPTKFIEFHMVIKGVESFHDAHELTEDLVDRLREKYPGSIVTIHADPEGGR